MNCTVYEQKCSSYCSSDSICRPGQRGLIKNPDNPLCICSLDYFGPSCHIRNEACKSDPCGLNGTCHLTNDPTGEKPIVCQCSKQFYGDRCQDEKVPVAIDVNMTLAPCVSVVQFYDGSQFSRSTLGLRHQMITTGLPLTIRYYHDQEKAPFLSLLKTYEGFSDPQYYVLYVQWYSAIINVTSTPRLCPNAISLLPRGKLFAF
ncbi:unnamed protein product [Adineta steineri]|uniref:EGF-like domain-containing protein n=1 Tax=Adineta steineri TaxID=433720 RepID=A0A815PQ66_9BILA|nr:unnamed protein product [Adineta steineri]CAF1630824.1 unnamed protein product [Adineta steineri]